MSVETREAKLGILAGQWPQYAGLIARAIEEGTSFSHVQSEVLKLLAGDQGNYPTPGLEVGQCLSYSREWRAAARDFLLIQTLGRIPNATDYDREKRTKAALEAGSQMGGGAPETNGLPRSQAFGSPSNFLWGLAERCVRRPKDHLGNTDLICRSFSSTSSDFPDILIDAANVALQAAFQAQPRNWEVLGRIRPAKDFKDLKSVKTGSVNLVETPELVPIPAVTPPDNKTTYRLKTYAAEMGVSRQAFIGDGVGAFLSQAEQFAEATNRLIGDTVFSLLTSAAGVGPTMTEDGQPLFSLHVNRVSGANYIAGIGAPDAAGIAALSNLVRKQKGFIRTGDTAPTMNLNPRYLLAPAALAAQAQITLASLASPESEGGDNPAIVRAPKLLIEPRLDAATNGATAWYLISTDCPGLELAFLNGNARPTVTQQRGDPMGFRAAVVLDFACAFTEHRGWARTRGA